MRQRILAAVVCLFANVSLDAQSSTPGQVIPPAPAPATTATPPLQGATVRGRVINSTGATVPRAQVTLDWPREAGRPPRTPLTAKTNALGSFEFTNVPAGLWGVLVVRAPYLAMVWGPEFLQPNELGRGTNLDLKGGQVVDGIDITLRDGVVVAGRIFDERGQPMPDVIVTASTAPGVSCNDSVVLSPLAGPQLEIRDPALDGMTGLSAQTNARGEFRIARLFPGSYYFCAKSGESWPIRRDQPDIRRYATTFYPGVTEPNAQPIVLRIGEALTGLEWKMGLARTYRVSGRLTDAGGQPIASTPVLVRRVLREFVPQQGGRISDIEIVITNPNLQTTTLEDGSFALDGVQPGEYYVGTGSASIRIVVNDSDITGISLSTP